MTARTIRNGMLAIVCLLPPSSLYAQLDGGFGLESGTGTQRVQTERQERGGAIIIQWSEAMNELSGFSNKTGRWQKLKIEPQETIQPNCVEFVGAVRLKNAIAAYSGETGTWDVVLLPEASTALPSVSPDVAQFKEGEHFYAFASSTGRWTSPTDPALKTLSIWYPSTKHVTAAEMHERLLGWMQTVPASEVGGSVQFLNGVLSVLPRKKAWLEAVQAEIARIDTPQAEVSGQVDPRPVDRPASLESQLATLRRQLGDVESAVISNARATKSSERDDTPESRELRTLVEQAFDVRQQLQELEARRMRLKLQQIEANLAQRAKARDALIVRRLKDLQSLGTGEAND